MWFRETHETRGGDQGGAEGIDLGAGLTDIEIYSVGVPTETVGDIIFLPAGRF